ncbi:hypothetical protein [Nonlabens sp. Asnod3-A02]|uniref:hypothetical protein n=1 Tax=Nonlabens sp. Asnod3-A02 TaxID=3160579 RepID=UPI00386B1492
MKETFVGHKFKLLNSEKTGITLELNSWSSENMVEKYSVSFDKENIIERITKDRISFGEKVSKTDFFKRLIRDIQASEEKTREFASAILCDFLEFDITDFDLKDLKLGIENIIEQITVEKNVNSEHKLVEGLFEFIWHKKLSKKAEVQLLERLTEIDSYHIWSYLEDELEDEYENLGSEKLKKYYIENKPKWDEKNDSLYGKKSILDKVKSIFTKKTSG